MLVWIHGGGYDSYAFCTVDVCSLWSLRSYAQDSANTYPGEDLVQESGYGVIVVTVQYRLGLFGRFILLLGKSLRRSLQIFRLPLSFNQRSVRVPVACLQTHCSELSDFSQVVAKQSKRYMHDV